MLKDYFKWKTNKINYTLCSIVLERNGEKPLSNGREYK